MASIIVGHTATTSTFYLVSNSFGKTIVNSPQKLKLGISTQNILLSKYEHFNPIPYWGKNIFTSQPPLKQISLKGPTILKQVNLPKGPTIQTKTNLACHLQTLPSQNFVGTISAHTYFL